MAEPHSPIHVRTGALPAISNSESRTACWGGLHERHGDVTRGRETHRHDYTRPPAALSDELSGLSTSLGLFASPPLILSTESVVVMKWKGMSTSIATRAASPSGDASRKRGIGTTRAHELGLRCYLDPCARG